MATKPIIITKKEIFKDAVAKQTHKNKDIIPRLSNFAQSLGVHTCAWVGKDGVYDLLRGKKWTENSISPNNPDAYLIASGGSRHVYTDPLTTGEIAYPQWGISVSKFDFRCHIGGSTLTSAYNGYHFGFSNSGSAYTFFWYLGDGTGTSTSDRKFFDTFTWPADLPFTKQPIVGGWSIASSSSISAFINGYKATGYSTSGTAISSASVGQKNMFGATQFAGSLSEAFGHGYFYIGGNASLSDELLGILTRNPELLFEYKRDYDVIYESVKTNLYTKPYISKKSYTNTVLNDNPVCYLNGSTSGTSMLDIAGAYPLTMVNTPAVVSEVVKKTEDRSAVDFNGSTQYAHRAETDFRGSDESGTVEFWCIGNARFGTARSDASTSYFNFLYSNGIVKIQHDANGVTYNDIVAHVDFTFHSYRNPLVHVVFQSTGSVYKIFINGKEYALTVNNGTNDGFWFADQNNRNNVYTGALVRDTVSEYYNGTIDEIAIYDYVLSPGQIKEHYEIGIQASKTNIPIALNTEPKPITKNLYAVVYEADRPIPNEEHIITGRDGWNAAAVKKYIKPEKEINSYPTEIDVAGLTANTSYRAAFCWSDRVSKSNIIETNAFPEEYYATVASDSPVAWWRLNDNTKNTNAVLGLPFDGTNGSTTTTDVVSSKTATFVGNAQISTAGSKFGGSSLLLDGTGDYIHFPTSTDWDFGTGAATIECWLYLSAYPATSSWAAIAAWFADTNNGWRLLVGDTGQLHLSTDDGTNNGFNSSTSVVPLNKWVHIACVLDGSTNSYGYVNGGLVASKSGTSFTAPTSTTLKIGSTNGSNWFVNGYIDDFRITKGEALYSDTFIPPQKSLFECTDETNTYDMIYYGKGDDTGTSIVPTNTIGSSFDTGASVGWAEADVTSFRGSDNTGSIECWVTPGTTGAGYIFMSADSGVDLDVVSLLISGGRVKVFVSGTATSVYITPVIISADTTYHIVLTTNGSAWKIYVDGVNQSLSSEAGTNTGQWFNDCTGCDKIGIGRYDRGSTGAFNGTIDEVAVYSSELTEAQVIEHYQKGTYERSYERQVKIDTPIAYWRLGDSGSTAIDEIGTYDLAYTNTPTLNVNPLITNTSNKAVTFTAANSEYAAGTNSVVSALPLSIECWFTVTDLSTFRGILATNNTSNYAGIQILIETTGKLIVRMGDNAGIGSGNRYDSSTPTGVININKLVHLVVTATAYNSVSIYINGISQVISNNGTSTSVSFATGDFDIGVASNTSYNSYFDGTIDEVAVYDSILSADQVLAHYNRGYFG